MPAGLPPVTLVWDRYDDLPHTLAALEAHAPERGQITLHPTPGTDSLTALAWDVLAALGKPPPLTCYRLHDTDAPWAITAAWALACEVTHLTVLRAHLLNPARLNALLTLRTRTGLRLALVCHQRRIPSFLERALRTVPHRGCHRGSARPRAGAAGHIGPDRCGSCRSLPAGASAGWPVAEPAGADHPGRHRRR
jgi:hypothetical protein